MTLLSGKEARELANWERYHTDPDRYRDAARKRYQDDPEVFRERSRQNRLKRTDEQQTKHLNYSKSYYEKNKGELNLKKKLHHAQHKDEINGRKRLAYAGKKDEFNGKRRDATLENTEFRDAVLPILIMLEWYRVLREDRLAWQWRIEEAARLARKKMQAAPVTRDELKDAVDRFLDDGGRIEKIPTNYQKPAFGIVRSKG